MATNLLVSGRARLFELIRITSWRESLVEDLIELSAPVAVNAHGRNTRLVITPKVSALANKELKGKRTLFYNRLSLSEVFPDGISLEPPTSEETLVDLLETIRTTYHVLLLPEDIVDADLSTNPVAISAAPNSYGWYGSTPLIFSGTPAIIPDTLLFDGGGYFMLDSGAILKND